ncbi:methyltransferase domain-containing protein [Lutimaribacter sp. EGI FJ00015]|uniref:Methyltransferase domain-containing protein n=1 Tax=Lutimaribacter degradans TaxID=2945989 RepID=A0ACC5ZRK5_9RHOB|nr:methyltransferase domain-containing protein [Lutimaribacter sp. EGI FJ00013]MCM2560598.1 methyltransferase domain-containing protein [Lutimaribacter sp. EGI FJ00013]MCO0612459.1 methyltransferase domain-containing protein [Lutimaribacter sp. EGI FJ00015]MCO0634422.1 methyltransferase domain-containing protein [Lutimaribacter sp. EGI FJ00014]
MVETTQTDWDPGAYDRFRGQRLRPAQDLIHAVGSVPAGDIVDLGCGSGVAAEGLRARFGDRRLIGVDTSATMLAKATATGLYDRLDQADITLWRTDAPPALIFSNAALHWLGAHDRLVPRLAAMLAPGGTLAVQVPHQNNAPSHRVWLSLADEMFPGRYDGAGGPDVLLPADYHHLLSPLGSLTLWETEYYQLLPADKGAHPVRRYTEATFARPLLATLDDGERAQLIAAYEAVMEKAYPRGADGSVLFPFRRLFFTLVV